MNRQDLTLLTDLYELTMMQGYYEESQNEVVIFDVFFRQNPCNNGYSVCAGLAQVIDYIKNLNFTYEDVDYLRSLKIFVKISSIFERFPLQRRHLRHSGRNGRIPKRTSAESHCSDHGSAAC